ncbi:MAG TPA: hypothetical protein VFO29_06635 [Candidatus Rubrimentiphilum sp.]|nr:hypothetical protein [Candidatus Rubrimentiphilum sp.]
MSGLVVFSSLRDALNAGYHIYGRSERGYLARLRTDGGWAMALVECVPASTVRDAEQPDSKTED